MNTEAAFKHLVAHWTDQPVRFRKKHRQRKSQFITGKGVGEKSKKKILAEAGYTFHPEQWDAPRGTVEVTNYRRNLTSNE